MGDLILAGTLNLGGMLKLSGDGGKVMVDSNAALLDNGEGTGSPVIQPPPPVGPIAPGPSAKILKSFNATVTVSGTAIVTMAMYLQDNMWPGMVLPSSTNSTVTINQLPINVENDKGVTFPSGGSVTFSTSGQ